MSPSKNSNAWEAFLSRHSSERTVAYQVRRQALQVKDYMHSKLSDLINILLRNLYSLVTALLKGGRRIAQNFLATHIVLN